MYSNGGTSECDLVGVSLDECEARKGNIVTRCEALPCGSSKQSRHYGLHMSGSGAPLLDGRLTRVLLTNICWRRAIMCVAAARNEDGRGGRLLAADSIQRHF
eukprot:SAG11_NODE_458_length_9290_cov_2.641388_11_plen_102_part_00